MLGLLGSSILASSAVDAQTTASCNWFTGTYKDVGKGVIVHIGGNRVIVYNGNPTPLDGRCIDNERIEVNFGNKILTGRRTRNAPDVAWSNQTVWRREGNTVAYPLPGF
ncbi:MAG TPA: hypothetical protein VE956_13865 [Nodularia sp. (in: cyanobacteria)]|nr:hypothetical protein [Nodularia sp. (in: cyanobacteria)]